MENLNENELMFIRDAIANGVRMDMRGCNDERVVEHIHSDISQSDGSVRLKRGSTEIEVSLQFKETYDTLVALDLAEDESMDLSYVEFTPFSIPRTIIRIIHEFLSPYRLGIRICLNVMNDDGNVYDLFFIGLNTLLHDLDIPALKDLSRTERRSLDIPIPRTIALFGDSCVRDPTTMEERASSGIIHIFIDRGMIFGCAFEKNSNINHKTLIRILEDVQSIK